MTERVQRYELNRVSDMELLSLFLSRRQDQSTEARARALLAEYGSLSALIGKPLGDSGSLSSLTARQRAQLIAAAELARRSAAESLSRQDVLSCPEQVRTYLALHLSGLEHEVFAGLLQTFHERWRHFCNRHPSIPRTSPYNVKLSASYGKR